MIKTVFQKAARFALTLVIVCLAGFAGNRAFAVVIFSSGSINFDYQQTFVGLPPFGPGAAAIGSPGDIWNANELGNQNGTFALVRNDGAPLGVTWTMVSGGGQSGAQGGTYGRLFDVLTAFYSASIDGLTPGQQYSLYLYSCHFFFDHLTVNGVDFYTPGVGGGDINSLTEGNEYVVHSVVADPSGKLVFTPIGAGGPNPAFITAWQLTPVPEPGVASLAALAAAAMALRACRARKRFTAVKSCRARTG